MEVRHCSSPNPERIFDLTGLRELTLVLFGNRDSLVIQQVACTDLTALNFALLSKREGSDSDSDEMETFYCHWPRQFTALTNLRRLTLDNAICSDWPADFFDYLPLLDYFNLEWAEGTFPQPSGLLPNLKEVDIG